jgi:hypothetical protein
MTTVYLERIIIKFPDTHIEFNNQLALLLDVLGQSKNQVLELTSSDQSFFPKIFLDFQSEHSDILTDFILSNGEITSVKIENSTGLNKQSPHSYRPVSIGTVNQRFLSSGVKLVGIDHVGFNLPWFSSGLHPNILRLREYLYLRCLYHKFPTGEPWDFIIPGDTNEIVGHKAVDYVRIRKPKFEIVSFDKASIPLIQFDIAVNIKYETFVQLFPESLKDTELRNIWVYLENPYPIDVCLVINEFADGDWSDFFKGCKL